MPAGLLLVALLAAPAPAHAAARPSGTVVGTLRHKGCSSAPPHASVTVIGRDAGAQADAEGHFALALPPGSYSLVIAGPGLVPDQRVDEVQVAAGQTHDLGTVEVWPEERPPGCANAPAPPPAPDALVATAPDTPALDLPGTAVAPASAAGEQIWVRGAAGGAAGQFGLSGNPSRDDEDALGPPSFAVGPQGGLWVLDTLNGRVQRFDAHGRFAGSFPLRRHAGDEPLTEADLVVADDGHVFIYTENEQATLTEHDASGRTLVGGALPPSLRGVAQLCAGRSRPIFLMQNGQAVKAELGWGGLRAEGLLPGIPAGDLYAQAVRLDRWRAAVKLSARDGRVRRTVQLHSRVPITGVRLVGVDRRGEIVLAVDRAEGGDDGTPQAEVLLLALDQHGHLSAVNSVPPGARRYEFREFALAPDGAVVQMQSDVAEVRFVRWPLRPPPRDAVAGEGLVRGRVVDPGRGIAGATAIVARLHLAVPIAADGAFEVRLPAGSWHLAFRRAPAPGLDATPVELRVAVAAGATVDLGTVSVVPRPRPPALAPTVIIGPLPGVREEEPPLRPPPPGAPPAAPAGAAPPTPAAGGR
ncbi:carboxypeptidase regulatory-like domain-containing protein [Anaeromyxobacter diazotrophicus]|uniref:Carboxypeptidase regulatory-like domain-containing protein n=1 Tax=Anaeromyxobacter diazotrophicus TaxID=2590199 RepID=A0A7I9VN76_9BACT|nr:carboxypeptidase regulatory-like domain-containing protein [Anaeromyxobacter diazotrophicus]GEJ57864.1 hypothetical protein AMYX_26050 [Anaeromyxobacter diazotrophicus]